MSISIVKISSNFRKHINDVVHYLRDYLTPNINMWNICKVILPFTEPFSLYYHQSNMFSGYKNLVSLF